MCSSNERVHPFEMVAEGLEQWLAVDLETRPIWPHWRGPCHPAVSVWHFSRFRHGNRVGRPPQICHPKKPCDCNGHRWNAGPVFADVSSCHQRQNAKRVIIGLEPFLKVTSALL